MLVNRQGWDGLWKHMVWIKIRVMAVVAVARPPAGINRELGQVGKPLVYQSWVNPRGGTARQSPKRI